MLPPEPPAPPTAPSPFVVAVPPAHPDGPASPVKTLVPPEPSAPPTVAPPLVVAVLPAVPGAPAFPTEPLAPASPADIPPPPLVLPAPAAPSETCLPPEAFAPLAPASVSLSALLVLVVEEQPTARSRPRPQIVIEHARDVIVYPIRGRFDPAQPGNVAAGTHLASKSITSIRSNLDQTPMRWSRIPKVPRIDALVRDSTSGFASQVQ